MKREPSAQNRKDAGVMHEMFTAFVDEGFTEDQAIALLQAMLTAQVNKS